MQDVLAYNCFALDFAFGPVDGDPNSFDWIHDKWQTLHHVAQHGGRSDHSPLIHSKHAGSVDLGTQKG